MIRGSGGAVVTAPPRPKVEKVKREPKVKKKQKAAVAGGVPLQKQKMQLYNGKKAKPLMMAQSLRTLAMVLKVGEAEARALEVVGHEFRRFDVGRAYIRAAASMREQGATFSQAMLSEDVFPRTVRELINASPTSQAIQMALTRAAKLISQSRSVKKKMLTALIQPAFMLGLCLVFMFVATAFIIPGFIGTFAALKSETPPSVGIVVAAAEITKYVMGALIVLITLFSVFWFGWGKRNDKVVEIADKLAIRTGIIGPILQLSSASRMFELLTANLTTGRGEAVSLESAGAGCGNEAIHAHAARHAEKMRVGAARLTDFADSPLFPPNARYMLKAAPSVKQQIDIMNELSPEYRAEADNRLEVFSKTIEPIVNYLVYAVAGLLIVAVVVPMYAMFPALMDMGGEPGQEVVIPTGESAPAAPVTPATSSPSPSDIPSDAALGGHVAGSPATERVVTGGTFCTSADAGTTALDRDGVLHRCVPETTSEGNTLHRWVVA